MHVVTYSGPVHATAEARRLVGKHAKAKLAVRRISAALRRCQLRGRKQQETRQDIDFCLQCVRYFSDTFNSFMKNQVQKY